jgi:hypothetical protein
VKTGILLKLKTMLLKNAWWQTKLAIPITADEKVIRIQVSQEENNCEEGEESGTEYGLNDTYDEIRYGARLILTYEVESNSFVGTVENTTEETLRRVRVEVHLSNGVELGPTNTVDLAPGEKGTVKLTAISTDFDKWSAHPEVGGGDGG